MITNKLETDIKKNEYKNNGNFVHSRKNQINRKIDFSQKFTDEELLKKCKGRTANSKERIMKKK